MKGPGLVNDVEAETVLSFFHAHQIVDFLHALYVVILVMGTADGDVNMMGIEGTADVMDIAQKTNYCLLLGGGIGFDLGFGTFFIEGIYAHGLRNINKGGTIDIVLEGNVIVTEDVDALEIKTRGFQMMAGFTFQLRSKE